MRVVNRWELKFLPLFKVILKLFSYLNAFNDISDLPLELKKLMATITIKNIGRIDAKTRRLTARPLSRCICFWRCLKKFKTPATDIIIGIKSMPFFN
jgi:hypothetical protein